MKEVLLRIFEANPNKKDFEFSYFQDRTEHYLEICSKVTTTRIHFIEFHIFDTLGKGEQQSFINMINAILDWYNLQP